MRLILDCDGVILRSNSIKTEAFMYATEGLPENIRDELRRYHLLNGGMSRHKKFEWFVKAFNLPHRPDFFLKRFGAFVFEKLLVAELAEGLDEIAIKHGPLTVVTGSDEKELINVFEKRGLIEKFQGGILGSPQTKKTHLMRLKNESQEELLYLGDSVLDAKICNELNLRFAWVSGWADEMDERAYASFKLFRHYTHLREVMSDELL